MLFNLRRVKEFKTLTQNLSKSFAGQSADHRTDLTADATEELHVPQRRRQGEPEPMESFSHYCHVFFLRVCVIGSQAACAESGLVAVLHKLWAWCTVEQTLLAAVVSLLCTMTAGSTRGEERSLETKGHVATRVKPWPVPGSQIVGRKKIAGAGGGDLDGAGGVQRGFIFLPFHYLRAWNRLVKPRTIG